MAILAVVILLIKAPFLMLGYLFKHKALLIVMIIAIVAIFAISAMNNKPDKEKEASSIPAYQEIAPGINEAPYVVATTSRIYYVVQYSDDQQIVTLQRYYFYDKKKWQLAELPLQIDRGVYGDIRIYQR